MADAALRDRSLALLRHGYRFTVGCRRPAEVTRLLGRRTVIVGGRDGAQLFYDDSRLRREGALPAPLKDTLFGKGAVHGLDDDEHRHRKQLFLSLLTPAAAKEIAARAEGCWDETLAGEGRRHAIRLFEAATRVHCTAVCGWAGVPAARVGDRLAHDLAAMVDGFGSVGPRHVAARRARRRADAWVVSLITDVRAGRSDVTDGAPLRAVADYRDPAGQLLPARVAAVELLNVLRPTVAVAWFAAFTAVAVYGDPRLAARLHDADDDTVEGFAHELRRLYPFVPVLGARARRDFDWRGIRFHRDDRVLLDVYGTLHDPALWPEPERFDLDRFAGTEPDPFTLIPQGGGDVATGHRCPGERVAIELIKTAARVLVRADYQLPAQDLRVPLNRMPTRPRSGVVLVRR